MFVEGILSYHILYTLIFKKKLRERVCLPSAELKDMCYHVWPTLILVILKMTGRAWKSPKLSLRQCERCMFCSHLQGVTWWQPEGSSLQHTVLSCVCTTGRGSNPLPSFVLPVPGHCRTRKKWEISILPSWDPAWPTWHMSASLGLRHSGIDNFEKNKIK